MPEAQTVVGIFDSKATAERAKVELMRSGIPGESIELSAGLTDDGIAAEAPGQSYEHQAYSGSKSDTDQARFNSALRAGACILSVASESAEDRRRVAALLRRAGARGTKERPA